MSNLKNLSPVAHLVINTTKNKKVGFASLVYTNKEGETSRHLVNLNATFANAKIKDIATLQALKDSDFDVYGETKELMIEAKNALLEAFIKPNENRSNGQIDAYTKINDAMKYHNVSGDLYLYALRVKKEVLIEGAPRKEVKSAPLTIAKRKVEKDFDLKSVKYGSFKIDSLAKATLNGDTLLFE